MKILDSNIQLFPVKTNLPVTASDDPRLGRFVQFGEDKITKKTRIAIIGFPSEEGVKRNGGRPGTAMGPNVIRTELFRLTPSPFSISSFKDILMNTVDLGNLKVVADVEQDQENLGTLLSRFLNDGIIPIILGGGHETAFGHFYGYIKARQKCYILNWDAHADVRELNNSQAHSGSPFRQAIEHESNNCLSYTVAGLLPHSVSLSHLEYIKNNNGYYVMKDDIDIDEIDRIYSAYDDNNPMMVTFDMDAVDQAYAPGVSAPATNGLTPNLWLHAAKMAGKNRNVTSFDIVELNPQYDRDNQTARLAALTIWNFILGLTERS